MSKTSKSLQIKIGDLRSSAQVALLGVIGPQILGICIDLDQENMKMIVFAEGRLSLDEKEAFDVATTEIMADFAGEILIDVRFVENTKSPLRKCSGIWIFVRYGCQVES